MTDQLTFADRIAMLLGGGLVLIGTVVFGVFETLIGNPHAVPVENEAGQVVQHTTFNPDLRAYVILAGLLVWFVYALYKLARPTPGGERTTTSGRSTTK